MPAFELASGVSSLPPEEWNALVGEESPFLEWEWLASLEDAGCVGPETGWQARPLVARENGRLVAACPVYVKGHSEGEFVYDWAWADAAERAGIHYYPKLLVGVPFTPVGGARFLVARGQDRHLWIEQMASALREICLTNEFSGVHVNFCSEEEIATADENRFLKRVGIQYHWHNRGYESFDDWLGVFRSKRRNQIRRERRALLEDGVRISVLTGPDIEDEIFESMFRCYLATIGSRAWGRQYLNRRFFDLLAERFRHRLCFVVARRGDEGLAGTTNVVKGNRFYGRYWGALRPLRHLHFNVCYYAPVEWCIERGLDCVEPGAGGDYKWLRGFDATPTFSLHFLAQPRLAGAVGRFLEAERAQAREVIARLDRASPVSRTFRSGTRRPRR